MKQIKRLKREKVSLFLAAAVLSLGILSGCGGESKEAKEARMTGIEQLNAGNYQDAIDRLEKRWMRAMGSSILLNWMF